MRLKSVDLYDLARKHGGRVYDGGRRWLGPGPGHSRRDASLSVLLADTRPLIYSFAGDPLYECAAFLGIEHTYPGKVDGNAYDRLKRQREADSRRRQHAAMAFCQRVWQGCLALPGTLAAQYLETRAIGWNLADLAFHPNAPRSYAGDSTAPALIALARSLSGTPTAIQATYLAPDGKARTGRATFGVLIGASVRLAPPGSSLAVGEGIETSASFQKLEGVATWATLGTANLGTFSPPACVRRLIIAADGDPAGLKAAHALAARLQNRCIVTISQAPAGADWNDVAMGKAHV
jgi:putative DNA primase/helicase